MNIHQLLNKIGINNFEQEVFLLVLKYNQIGVGKIAKILNKPRSTVYSCIDKLTREQLLLEQKEPSGAMYSARNSKELVALFEKRKKDLDRIALDIKQHEYLFSEYQYLDTGAPKVLIHYGAEAVEVIQSQNPKERGYFMRDIDVYQKQFQVSIDQIVDIFFKGESYESKSILINSASAKKYKEILDKRYKGKHQVRFLGENIISLFSDTMLMDDRYLHISYKEPITVIEVKNPTFFDAQKILFEGLWDSLDNK